MHNPESELLKMSFDCSCCRNVAKINTGFSTEKKSKTKVKNLPASIIFKIIDLECSAERIENSYKKVKMPLKILEIK